MLDFRRCLAVKTAGAVVEQQKQVSETAPRMLDGAAHAIDTRALSPYFEVRINAVVRNLEMTTATLTTKGQITIPKDIRERLMLHTGDKLDFSLTESGDVLLKPVTRHVDEVFGRLGKSGQAPLTPAEMDAAIQRRMAETGA